MTEPTEEHATKNRTRTAKALRMEAVPEEKLSHMVRRTITGAAFSALGVALLYFMYHAFIETKELSVPLLIAGVSFFGLGWVIMSGQVVGRAIVSLKEPGHVVRSILKGDEGRADS